MRELHLFAGVGGGILAGKLLGHRCVGAVEIDEYCRCVLEARQADGQLEPFPIHDDIRTFDGIEFLDGLAREWYGYPTMAGKPKKLSNEDMLRAAHLYSAGLSVADTALAFGVTRQGMWERLKKVTTMRPRERFGADNTFYRGGAESDPRVHDITERAILCGLLKRRPCEVCGSFDRMSDGRSAVQAHHCDYNKPLEVLWLCQKHHHEWHKNNKPIRRRDQEAPGIDIVAGGFP